MIKRLVTAVTLLSIFPVMAYAASWSLNTWVKSAGGNIVVRGGTPQTSVNGSVFKSYTTSQPFTVTVNPNAGYGISQVNYNNVVTSSPTQTTYTVQGPAAQNVYATFTPLSPLTVTAATSAGGTVTPSSLTGISVGTKLAADTTFTFTPSSATYSVASISGVPPSATITPSLPALGNVPVTVTLPAGFTFTANVALYGTFSALPVARTTPTQVVTPGTLTTLDGSPSTGTISSYTWTQTSGPGFPTTKVFADNTPGKQVTFTPNATGIYTFSLAVTGGSTASTTVTVSGNFLMTARNQCYNCHAANNVGVAQNVFPNWSSSKHQPAGVICSQCHVGANTGGHPGLPLTTLYQICGTCHFDATGTVPLHPVDIGVNTCVTCHNPHSTQATLLAGVQSAHYNNITTGTYPASYVSSKAVCSNCHYATTQNGIIRHEWAISGHSGTTIPAWMSKDFKTMDGCVRCHTTTGFIAYSTGKVTSAWGDPTDKTKEVLRCVGCHSDITNGTVRNYTPTTPYADDSYTNPDVGKSNVCLSCHSGTKNGKSITARLTANASFANMSLIDPHYMATGGTLYGVGGYQFPGRTYNVSDVSKSHRDINSIDANNNVLGPCVTCHKNAYFDHTFHPTWSNNPLCSTCHFNMDDAKLGSSKTELANALVVLKAQLGAKGFVYTPVYPYFTSTNWGIGQAGANTMGAAFNYIMISREPGAYAHNPGYAKQLVLDSIDFLDNGIIDDSVSTFALPNLVASGAISQAVADSLSNFAAVKTQCTACHGGTSATQTPMATNAHPAHISSAYGPGFYLGTTISACQTCHTYGTTTHMNGVVDVVNGAGSACAQCHAGVIPTWTSATRLDCTTCHSATPAVLPNGVAAPYKANFASSGHGQYTASNQCITCHDPDSQHITGSLGIYTRLRLTNDNNLCASCHNNATIVSAAKLNMVSHVTMDGRTLGCRECHDPHGTSNLSMIRQQINGSTIVFTDNVNGLIDTSSNRGLCQVCHTLTNHYRAGVPESNHYTSGCLTCHTHNSGGGAFTPAGGSCDTCHGYPPAPRNTVATFGTTGNWENARFEDYSGGGGAHLVASHISPNAKPADGWTNCAICHNGGNIASAPNHRMTTPLRNHVDNVTVLLDPKVRFSTGFSVYTGAKLVNQPARNVTGSCYNIACHMSPSASWSSER